VLGQEWYTTILEDELVLTALPVESLGHRKEFERLNIKAVLTVVEPWELDTQVLGLKPIKNWGRGVVHKQISTRDFSSVAFPLIQEGADFIHENISLRRKVAVHCKAGIGRSAAMVIGYLVKHRGYESARSAYTFTSSKRPQIMLSGKQGRIVDQAKAAAA
jgi:protein-tyrosine phosphatase